MGISGRSRRSVAAVVAGAALVLAVAGCASSRVGAVGTATSRASPSTGWSEIARSPLTPRHDPLVAAVGGRYLVVGGSTGPACPPSASCIRPDTAAERDGATYDPATDRWARIAEAPVTVSPRSSVSVGDDLYLASHDFEGDDADHLLHYSTLQDRWVELPWPGGAYGSLVAGGGRVFWIGYGGPDSFDAVLDAVAGEWRRLPEDPIGTAARREATWIGGRLLLAAKLPVEGKTGLELTRLAVLGPDLRSWSDLGGADLIGWGPTAVGDVVVFPMLGSEDGGDWGRSYHYGGVFDPGSRSVRPLPEALDRCVLGGERSAPSGVGPGFVFGRRVYVHGCLLDPLGGAVERLPSPAYRDRFVEGIAADGSSILVWGGATATATGTPNLGDGHLLRVRSGV